MDQCAAYVDRLPQHKIYSTVSVPIQNDQLQSVLGEYDEDSSMTSDGVFKLAEADSTVLDLVSGGVNCFVSHSSCCFILG